MEVLAGINLIVLNNDGKVWCRHINRFTQNCIQRCFFSCAGLKLGPKILGHFCCGEMGSKLPPLECGPRICLTSKVMLEQFWAPVWQTAAPFPVSGDAGSRTHLPG